MAVTAVDFFGIRLAPGEIPAMWREVVVEGLPQAQGATEVTVTWVASGIPALVAAATVALAFATRWTRLLPLLALVPVPHVLVFLVHVDSHHPSDCHDCYSALGGAYHPLELFAVEMNVLGWVAGLALGAALRRASALLVHGDARLPIAS
jgi:hypothetical protein